MIEFFSEAVAFNSEFLMKKFGDWEEKFHHQIMHFMFEGASTKSSLWVIDLASAILTLDEALQPLNQFLTHSL